MLHIRSLVVRYINMDVIIFFYITFWEYYLYFMPIGSLMFRCVLKDHFIGQEIRGNGSCNASACREQLNTLAPFSCYQLLVFVFVFVFFFVFVFVFDFVFVFVFVFIFVFVFVFVFDFDYEFDFTLPYP